MNGNEFADHLHHANAHAADSLHVHDAMQVEPAADRLRQTLPHEIAGAEERLADMLFRIQAPYGSGGSGLW